MSKKPVVISEWNYLCVSHSVETCTRRVCLHSSSTIGVGINCGMSEFVDNFFSQ
jgi:hypothetical protein